IAGRDGSEREIWRRRVAADEARADEVSLDLPVSASEAATLVLRVTPDGGRRPAWALWQGLRVMGDPERAIDAGAPRGAGPAGVPAAGFIGNPVARGFNLDRGFDEFHSVYTQKVNLGEVTHADAFRNVLPGFFQGRAAGRFFAYVHYLEPHFPYDPPPPFNTMF